MKKLRAVLKATMSGDMNIFKFKGKKDEKLRSKLKNSLLFIFLTIILLSTSASYAYMMAEPLHEVGLTYVVLTLFIIVATIFVLLEGVYKSQGILFDAKDNDLLFSMPIKKRTVLFSRFIKLIAFQYIFDLIISVPAFGVYAIFEKPGASFYILSILMILLIPIIPTLIACIIGYIIKAISSLVKKKSLMQTVLSLGFTFALCAISFKTTSFIENIAEKATSINDMISRIYYPVGLFINCIQNFNIKDLVLLLLINIIPAIIYMFLFSIFYFKIISKTSEHSSNSKYNIKKTKFEVNSQLKALIKKEMRRYFSSPIYVINTIFGILIVLACAIGCSINFNGTINLIAESEGMEISADFIKSIFPKVYMCLLLFAISTVAITASSISLEGKSFQITKSLPVSTKKIFLAKILTSDIITIPFMIIGTIILEITIGFPIIDLLLMLAICLIMPNLIAVLGLIVNLRYPMLDAKSDTVVVKQSASSLISTLSGMVVALIPLIIFFALKVKMNIDLYSALVVLIYAVILLILWKVLLKYGIKKFKQID